MSKTPFVVISQHTNTKDVMTMHRYVGKTHYGTLKFNVAEIDDAQAISKLAEEYRMLGSKIYGEEDN